MTWLTCSITLYPVLLFSSFFLSGIYTRFQEEKQLLWIYDDESHTTKTTEQRRQRKLGNFMTFLNSGASTE